METVSIKAAILIQLIEWIARALFVRLAIMKAVNTDTLDKTKVNLITLKSMTCQEHYWRSMKEKKDFYDRIKKYIG